MSVTPRTLLSDGVTDTGYLQMEASRNINGIVDFIRNRFTERYITPMRVDRQLKHGFTVMAVSCLMIEALESFYQGWPDTRNKSSSAFRSFFYRHETFSFLRNHSQEFYRHVRCGILHQGETTGGWHIRRSGPVFEESTRTLNSKLFHDKVEMALELYCTNLKGGDWSGSLWKNFRKKMNAVCKNCRGDD